MPIYEYRCKKGHVFDVRQSFSDDPVSNCEVCGAPVQRVFHPVAVHFKGSGFYNTDYGTRNRSREKEAAAKADAKSEGAKETSKDSSASNTKSDSGSSSNGAKSEGAAKKKPETKAS